MSLILLQSHLTKHIYLLQGRGAPIRGPERQIFSGPERGSGHVAHMEESRGAYRVLVWKPEGRRPLGRPRRVWEDNIKMDVG